MNLLCIDTSGPVAGVALMEDGVIRYEAMAVNAFTHSQSMLPMVEEADTRTGLTVRNTDYFAAVVGPGSFTGVRIGVAAAKGFAWGAELPCCGVSTLAAMAVGLGVWQGYVCPVMDARRSQVYNALFHVDCGKYTRIREDRAISLQELGEDVKNLSEPVFLVGDGSVLCYNALSGMVPGLVLPQEARMHQRAAGVALEAERLLKAGGSFPGEALVPNYLRLSQAERERNEKLMQNK